MSHLLQHRSTHSRIAAVLAINLLIDSKQLWRQATVASVFYPNPASAADNLQNATLFTRIHIRTTPQAVQGALSSPPQLRNTFRLGHLSDILVFDNNKAQHITHVRAVLEMLRSKDMKADIELCAFDKPSWTEAGFHIDPVGKGGQQAFMVVLREHLAPDALASIDRRLL